MHLMCVASFFQVVCSTKFCKKVMWTDTKTSEKSIEKSKKYVWHLQSLKKCFQGAQGCSPIIFYALGLVAPGRFGGPPEGPQNRQNLLKLIKMWYRNLMIFRDASREPSQRVSGPQSGLQSMKIDEKTPRTRPICTFQKGMNFWLANIGKTDPESNYFHKSMKKAET